MLTPEQVATIEEGAAGLRSYVEAVIERRRLEPGDDLVTRLLEAEVDGERLSADDVVAMTSGFVFAGAETTRRQLTAAILVFAEQPEAWERLAAAPDLVPAAVEEVLRHRPIVPGLTRRTEEPFDRDELDLPAGQRLLLSFVTANHDPAQFEEPERFDVERANSGSHVTFGRGPHFCVGAGLAHMELQEALRTLVARFGPPQVHAAGDETALVAPDWVDVSFARR